MKNMRAEFALNVKERARSGPARREGEREASGKLQRPSAKDRPNLAAISTDPTRARNPLDAAFVGNWIDLAAYGAARTYLALYRQTTPHDGPRFAQTSLPEADREMDEMRGRRLTPAEIVELWDRIVGDRAPRNPEEAERRAELAAAKWRAVNAAMSPAERAEVLAVCVRQDWPQWLLQRCTGEAARAKAIAEKRDLTDNELAFIAEKFADRWDSKRRLLMSGLRAIEAALRTG